MKYGVPTAFLVTTYFILLPDDYKLQFKKKIKEDSSMREYGGRDSNGKK